MTLQKAIMENNKGQQIKNKIDETKGMLIENIDKVLQRHTSIEVICRETESLRETSASFKGGAKNLRRRAIWNDVKCKLLMGVGVLVSTRSSYNSFAKLIACVYRYLF